MKYHVLASGSKGNCTLIESNGHCFLIDCGVSKKYLITKLKEINRSFEDIEALLITHSHSDHIKGIKYFSNIPIYGLKDAYADATYYLLGHQSFNLFDLDIYVIPLSHDKKNIGFVFNDQKHKLVYLTDTGYINEKLKENLRNADYYIIESNHDVEMLMNTDRPFVLKQRILSDTGHLSNDACCCLLNEIIGNNTKEIVFAHISEEANNFDLVEKCANEKIRLLENINYRCAKQFEIVSGGNEDEEN